MGGKFPQPQSLSPTGAADSAANVALVLHTLEGGTCKAYPEIDSPYELEAVQKTPSVKRMSSDVHNASFNIARTDLIESQAQYNGVNYCQDGNCSCQYAKITYKNGAKPDYWSTTSRSVPTGVCTGGTSDGFPCNPDNSSGPSNKCTVGGGSCNKLDKKETHIGLKGFCLEYDRSRPLNHPTDASQTTYACLTWLPIDVSVTGADVYNADTSAGYDPNIDAQNGFGQVYCANATTGGYNDDSIVTWQGNDSSSQGIVLHYFIPRGDTWSPNIVYEDCEGNLFGYQAGDHHEDATFARAACSNSTDLYQAMQTWAWHAITPDATVLRVETPVDAPGYHKPETHDSYI